MIVTTVRYDSNGGFQIPDGYLSIKNPPWHRAIPQGFATEPLTSAGREGMGVPSGSSVKHERVIRDYRKWK